MSKLQAPGASNVLVWSLREPQAWCNQPTFKPPSWRPRRALRTECLPLSNTFLFGQDMQRVRRITCWKQTKRVLQKWHVYATEMAHVVNDKKRERSKKGKHFADINELKMLSMHIFMYRWQHKELKQLLCKLTPLPGNGTAVIINDSSENYLCKYQDEVQSVHWGYNRVSIHPGSVLYYPCHCGDLIT